MRFHWVSIIEENTQETLLVDADVNAGYEIYLPLDIYSIYILLVDPNVASLFDAQIYAIGLQSVIDLSGLDELVFDDSEDIWAIVNESPVLFTVAGNYYLDFIFLETERVLGYPASFDDLIQGVQEPQVSAVDQITCPRCGGDGYVNDADLRRIQAMGHHVGDWVPGPCRLCDGAGWVAADFLQYRDIGNTPRESRM